MLKGVVYQNKPLIALVVGWHQSVQEIVALIDTGFTGELKIPPKKVAELGLEISHTEPVSLANEEIVHWDAALAEVSMENTVHVVSVLVGRGIPLVGVGLLKRFRYSLYIDFPHDTLTLQR
ncbi:hypothetical protein HYW17_01300 [Candidatus Uhrbacteria bacterium]|nr:hypothetical protein [Candidatus Uhrbacteria bacterium]